MNTTFAFAVGLLQAALVLLGFVQQHPELPQASRDQAQQVAQQAISQATQALSNQNTATQPPPRIVSSLSVLPTSGQAPLSVNINSNQNERALPGYLEFGDETGTLDFTLGGGRCIPANCSTNHTFANPGTYTIRLLDYYCDEAGKAACDAFKLKHTIASAVVTVTQPNLVGTSVPGIAAQIDVASLTDSWDTKTISGTASGTDTLSIKVVVAGKENSTDTWYFPYSNDLVPVVNGHWSIVLQKGSYSCNQYDVNIYSQNKSLLTSGTFHGNACGD